MANLECEERERRRRRRQSPSSNPRDRNRYLFFLANYIRCGLSAMHWVSPPSSSRCGPLSLLPSYSRFGLSAYASKGEPPPIDTMGYRDKTMFWGLHKPSAPIIGVGGLSAQRLGNRERGRGSLANVSCQHGSHFLGSRRCVEFS